MNDNVSTNNPALSSSALAKLSDRSEATNHQAATIELGRALNQVHVELREVTSQIEESVNNIVSPRIRPYNNVQFLLLC